MGHSGGYLFYVTAQHLEEQDISHMKKWHPRHSLQTTPPYRKHKCTLLKEDLLSVNLDTITNYFIIVQKPNLQRFALSRILFDPNTQLWATSAMLLSVLQSSINLLHKTEF